LTISALPNARLAGPLWALVVLAVLGAIVGCLEVASGSTADEGIRQDRLECDERACGGELEEDGVAPDVGQNHRGVVSVDSE